MPIIEVKAQLTDSERDALQKAISDGFLVDQGWKLGPGGDISTASGRILFEPGYVTAIRKVLG